MGYSLLSHRVLESETISLTGAPARARNSKSPSSLIIGSVNPRGSCHARPGASGFPFSSSKKPVSLKPVNAMAATTQPASWAAFEATDITVCASL